MSARNHVRRHYSLSLSNLSFLYGWVTAPEVKSAPFFVCETCRSAKVEGLLV